jgi:hypothetical protein
MSYRYSNDWLYIEPQDESILSVNENQKLDENKQKNKRDL